MLSPFPGMDPYLESPAFWSGFHTRFLTYLCDAIIDRLPEGYAADLEERIQPVRWDDGRPITIRPDAFVLRRGASAGIREGGPTAMLLEREPVAVPHEEIDEEEVVQRFIKIVRHPEQTLVAILELLSPWNKAEPGWSEYQFHRRHLRHQPVHLVEIDLLREGRRLPMGAPLPAGDYYALVTRYDQRPSCDVYAWTLRDRLPMIGIPLSAPEPGVIVDLAETFTQTYSKAQYRRRLPYHQWPPIRLTDQERSWLQEQITKAGLASPC